MAGVLVFQTDKRQNIKASPQLCITSDNKNPCGNIYPRADKTSFSKIHVQLIGLEDSKCGKNVVACMFYNSSINLVISFQLEFVVNRGTRFPHINEDVFWVSLTSPKHQIFSSPVQVSLCPLQPRISLGSSSLGVEMWFSSTLRFGVVHSGILFCSPQL